MNYNKCIPFKKDFVQFIKFSLVGISNAIVNFAVYSLFVYLGTHYFVANTVSFVVAVLNSFLWNSLFVFKKQENSQRNVVFTLLKTFTAYGITGIVLQSALLYLFIDKLLLSKYIAQIICIMINVPINFLLNKFWAYKIEKENG